MMALVIDQLYVIGLSKRFVSPSQSLESQSSLTPSQVQQRIVRGTQNHATIHEVI